MNVRAISIRSLAHHALPVLALSLGLGGCSVLLGNVRPIEEPAPVAKKNSPEPLLAGPWKLIPSTREASPSASTTTPDLNYQNQETGSTLAFTTGCRKSYKSSQPSLRRVAQQLGGALTRIQKREQMDIQVQGHPALRSTMTGTASGQEVTIHSVVLAREGCVFDLTLVSLRRHFEADRPAFEKLLATLPLPR